MESISGKPLPASVPHFTVYQDFVEEYDLLRSKMDREGNLLKEIAKIVALNGADIVELAAGTGKLTFLLAPFARSVKAFDGMQPMLDFARNKANQSGFTNLKFDVADNRAIPLPDGCADIVLEGWSIGYLVSQTGKGWEREVDKVLNEMERLLRPEGVMMIIGTLGTGAHTPKPPNAELAMLYEYLTGEKGFTRCPWFNTDYAFDSAQQAESLIRFFWSDRFGDFIRDRQMYIVPECTTIWYKRKEVVNRKEEKKTGHGI